MRLLLASALACAAIACAQAAEPLQPPTRVSPADWACEDATGQVISPHQRFDTALFACLNNPAGAFVQGGRYRINRPSEPDPEPTPCPAPPASTTRPQDCPAGSTGTWTQTSASTVGAPPTCAVSTTWSPSAPPTGACVVTLTAPVLSTPIVVPHTTAGRYTVQLTWSPVAGATSYEVRRCAGCDGSADPGMTLIKSGVIDTSYDNTNLPSGFSYRYKVRAMRDTEAGPMSEIVSATTPSEPVANRAPIISGTPATSVVSGQSYSFQPTATDADGDTLQFTIQNKPAWASFTNTDGRLSGTTHLADVGTYANILIGVSDGETTTNLAPFAVAVTAQPTGSATLSWTPPTLNTNGTTLTDLAGYRIAYGTSAATLTQTIVISNPALSTYIVQGLTPGAWFFAVRAYTSGGAESANSNIASRVVQ